MLANLFLAIAMSTYGHVQHQGQYCTVYAEVTSGSMSDHSQEAAYVAAWQQRAQPEVARIAQYLDAQLPTVLAQAGLPLTAYAKHWPPVWQASKDSQALTRHRQQGGGACNYRMAFYTVRLLPEPGRQLQALGQAVHRVDVLLSMPQLPSAAQLQALEQALADCLLRVR